MTATIRSVLTDATAEGQVRWGERAMRAADPHEVIVRVAAFSLNRGELNSAGRKPAGSPIGWDVAGTVDRTAPGGPAEGTRVVGFCRRQEGWAETVPLPVDDVAALPDGVSFVDAATLPVAGGTALACLDAAGRSLLGRRMLVTGVTGGVGGFAVQLGVLSGAHVIAQVRRQDQAEYAASLGAHQVAVTDDGSSLAAEGPFDVIVDGVGGPILQAALPQLDASGFAVNYGVTGSGKIELGLGAMLSKGRAVLRGLNLYAVSEEIAPRRWLARLVSLLADGRLKVAVAETADWSTVGATARKLLDRKFYGKAVLTAP